MISTPLLNDILLQGQVQQENGQPLPLHSHLPLLECRLLQAWLKEAQARHVVEIGFAYGISSLAICEIIHPFDGARLDIIDPHQDRDWLSIGTLNLARAGFANRYTLHQTPSEICLPQFLKEGRKFDFAFVDGWHTFDQVMLEFYYINRMLSPGGVVVFDDIPMPAVQKVCSYISTLECYQTHPPPPNLENDRTARIRSMARQPKFRLLAFKKISPDTRPWDWYLEF